MVCPTQAVTGLTSGEEAGIVVGVLLVVAITVGAMCFSEIRSRRRRGTESQVELKSAS